MIAAIEAGDGEGAGRQLGDLLEVALEAYGKGGWGPGAGGQGCEGGAGAASAVCLKGCKHPPLPLHAPLPPPLPLMADLPACQRLPEPAPAVMATALLLSHLLSRALAERPFAASDAPAWFEATARLVRAKLQVRRHARGCCMPVCCSLLSSRCLPRAAAGRPLTA